MRKRKGTVCISGMYRWALAACTVEHSSGVICVHTNAGRSFGPRPLRRWNFARLGSCAFLFRKLFFARTEITVVWHLFSLFVPSQAAEVWVHYPRANILKVVLIHRRWYDSRDEAEVATSLRKSPTRLNMFESWLIWGLHDSILHNC